MGVVWGRGAPDQTTARPSHLALQLSGRCRIQLRPSHEVGELVVVEGVQAGVGGRSARRGRRAAAGGCRPGRAPDWRQALARGGGRGGAHAGVAGRDGVGSSLPSRSPTMLAAAAAALRRASSRAASSSSAAGASAAADSLALAAFRASNASLPSIAGSTVLARVLRADRAFVTVDAGLKRPVRLSRAELRPDQLVSSPAAGAADGDRLRTGPGDVRVGDALKVWVAAVETPYGDPALAPEPRASATAAAAAAWAAIETSKATGGTVLGRVLNGVAGGGFAVGVGGVVGFLPFSMCSPATGE